MAAEGDEATVIVEVGAGLRRPSRRSRGHEPAETGQHVWHLYVKRDAAAHALLESMDVLRSTKAGRDYQIDVVVRIGSRELIFEVKNNEGTGLTVGDFPIEALTRELNLADRLDSDPRSLAGARAAIDAAWDALVAEWGLLSDYQLAREWDFAGEKPGELLTPLIHDRVLFGVRRNGARYFPGFQFDESGNVYPAVKEVLDILPMKWTNLDKALWFNSPNGWAGGRRPAELLVKRPKELIQAAQRSSPPTA